MDVLISKAFPMAWEPSSPIMLELRNAMSNSKTPCEWTISVFSSNGWLKWTITEWKNWMDSTQLIGSSLPNTHTNGRNSMLKCSLSLVLIEPVGWFEITMEKINSWFSHKHSLWFLQNNGYFLANIQTYGFVFNVQLHKTIMGSPSILGNAKLSWVRKTITKLSFIPIQEASIQIHYRKFKFWMDGLVSKAFPMAWAPSAPIVVFTKWNPMSKSKFTLPWCLYLFRFLFASCLGDFISNERIAWMRLDANDTQLVPGCQYRHTQMRMPLYFLHLKLVSFLFEPVGWFDNNNWVLINSWFLKLRFIMVFTKQWWFSSQINQTSWFVIFQCKINTNKQTWI